ncbi:hypothetical protein GBAR_LOCUS24882 [Geodia barretti]|uniref:Uncharacterized protein n=1 Tax=Geodia barretti TaxID=519541 RepID=A0AA35X5G4_GEOBA|nr:hypothetical protein GBAR_LOCUS24882 [Geodia barretti]
MTAQTLELETTTVTVTTMKMQESYAFQMKRLYVISSRLCHWKTLQNVVRKTLILDHQKHAYTGMEYVFHSIQ